MAEKIDEHAMQKLLNELKEYRTACRWGVPVLIAYGIFDRFFKDVPTESITMWLFWALTAWVVGEILNRIYQAMRLVQLNLIGINVSRSILEEKIEILKSKLP